MSSESKVRQVLALDCAPCRAWLKHKGHFCAQHASAKSEAEQAILQLIREARVEELTMLAKILPTEPANIPGMAVVDTGRAYQQTLKARLEELKGEQE